MTYEAATDLKNLLNGILNDVKVDNLVTYGVFTQWTTLFEIDYGVTLFPAKYQEKFTLANYSEKLAFARVAVKAQMSTPVSYETLIQSFDSELEKDAELSNYIKQAA
jgi:hypothetical protein